MRSARDYHDVRKRAVRDQIVELDDQPSDPPEHRADRVVIAGLLTASAVFAIGVSIARPAVDSRLGAPAAPAAATGAPSPAAPTAPLRPEGRRDLPVFIRPTLAPGAPLPSSMVIFRIAPDGSHQIDAPLPSPPDGIRWQSVHIP